MVISNYNDKMGYNFITIIINPKLTDNSPK